MTNIETLVSNEDNSVNFVLDNGQECRYVRRSDEKILVYISSHNGCNQSCRFCHLTQTGQTDMVPATIDEMVFQATKVLNHYKEVVMSGKQKPASIINFNWMARGEPLLNPYIVNRWGMLAKKLKTIANNIQRKLGIDPETVKVKFNISTIMPKVMLLHFLTWNAEPSLKPTIYYSLYSTDDKFRKRWLPKADDVQNAFTKLKAFQEYDGKVVFHWAFIKDQNDSEEDVDAIGTLIHEYGIQARFNLVRYNPYSCGQGTESLETTLQERFEQIKRYMMVPGSRIVPRVGFDVAASCGCFVEKSVIPIKQIEG